MLPTLNATGDLLLQRPLSKRAVLTNIGRGELVNFISPMNPKVLACKRVIGLPGDRVFLNGVPLDVPPGHLWLEGDNQNVSVDSRVYGPVPLALVQGKILARVWPSFIWFKKSDA
ncbi:hypothetical protein CROQUDRAFT_669299 [Cronartium quercuum f. sp. fusiforme G11]|uniref:Peptidase S26 domain-containing protein n=1 Tax=Cronartium quercuum f. sp. fusiforme G11 TaxID=708437 RepID=A0A9P6NLF1_9BASI|nr:hypothetical protein CROQUDRAFT_669299 [Cronartium quercuum f. sp. fusiforme G11]